MIQLQPPSPRKARHLLPAGSTSFRLAPPSGRLAGVAASRAEVYDAAEDQLRIEIGRGVVVDFDLPDGGGPATALTIRGERYERMAP